MKRKVTRVQEIQTALQRSKNYYYGEVFETGSGEFAVLWGDYPTVTVILPAELDVDAYGDVMDPFNVIRENATHPLLTESNLIFEGDPVFNWCKVALIRDGRIWLQLCEPQDATHIFVYDFQTAKGRPLSADDKGALQLGEYYHQACYRSGCLRGTMIVPAGYVRLDYQTGDAEKPVSHLVYGAEQNTLQDHFTNRAQEFLTSAQQKLEQQRSRRREYAEKVEQVQRFITEHPDELDKLQIQKNVLVSKANSSTGALTPSQRETFTQEIRTSLDRSAVDGLKMYGYGQNFEFSEQGIKDLSELIQAKSRELDNILQKWRERQNEQDECNKRKIISRRIAHAAADRHVRVFDSSSDIVYMKHKYGNYRDFCLSFNSDKVWIKAEEFISESYGLNEDGYEAILRELDLAIQQSKDYVCKAYVWIQNLFHRSED